MTSTLSLSVRRAAQTARPLRAASLAIAWLALCATGCGGGGGEAAPASASATASATSSPSQPPDDPAARRIALAEKLYVGTPRVPEGFRLDPAPAGATGPVATLHLKNTDLPGATPGAPRWELCSADPAEALGWSELRASWQGAYADLVETNASETMFEFVRVPRSDTSARLRHRVFRCAWLDRSGSDLDAATGPAGDLKLLPVTAATLGGLAEYLWQFTAFNNADHVVLASAPAAGAAGQVAWRIEMARLTRGANAGDCDRIERLAWTHAADAAQGALARHVEELEVFRARRENGVVQICGG